MKKNKNARKIAKQKFSKRLTVLVLILPFILSGCIFGVRKPSQSTQQQVAQQNGGLFRSEDYGVTWERVTTIYTAGEQKLSFDASNITTIALDPQDNTAVYVGTQHDGVFYSYDYGEGWFNTLTQKGTVNDIAVDPLRSCTIYAAIHNTIYKSEDCSRHWEPTYFESRAGQFITALTVDGKRSNIVYAGTSGGSILKSTDYGWSWDVKVRLDDYIKDIIVQNHHNPDILYASTQKKGVYRSGDQGEKWDTLMQLDVDQSEVDEEAIFLALVEKTEAKMRRKMNDEEYANFARQYKYKKFAALGGSALGMSLNSDKTVEDGIIYANRVGIHRLVWEKAADGLEGGIWKEIGLLTPKSTDTIYSVVVNPQNTKDVIYGTNNALFHSLDGGVNWNISSLPTNFTAKFLEFSLDNKFLYLGAYQIGK
ncbi:hypothetical protein C4566_01985 [Candidatus Parcubacteria bacterium]|nr:MAG: hypothetical protein C4566_01985 [Candidatus Parcubacteria bacterium]